MSENIQDNFETAPTVAQNDKGSQSLGSTTPHEDKPKTGEEKPSQPEETLPPEAQGEVNGGPLGCCLGVTIGLLLSLSLIILSYVFADPLRGLFQGNDTLLGLLVRMLMGLLAFTLAIFFGVLGWRLGKRFFREYEPPTVKERTRRARAKKFEQNI
jgi:hypothetical protein